ncbi:MAG: hypothetical protein HN726_00460 [Candidatus Magasanikbacteria bacterium]|jgi:hypothetical protein|nr:hypothetical protein [Candidatus Magasanikbacteria bacterium]MBT4221106.1 hypothetical protein [Candidatus Magasanikbacteria bacterium]MBT4350324.1 hypothetical protein [Candidatus Magasanikbacteria bacterium]MBT4541750.1 hypothetical protein [Candidatus Magasanikbacteria bacterium]MBT6253273.1 hypothetical protein [Candidatus Magasanikbacteria bacterium]
MKKRHTIALGMTVVAVTATVGFTASVSAKDHHKFSEDQREEVHQALENHDYESFKQAVGEEHPLFEKVTEENFEKFIERKKNGKWKRGLHKVRKHHLRGATKEAIEARDYAAWQEIVKDKGKRGEIINTEEKFNLFVDMIELRKEGKKDEAKAIADELGLKGHHRFQKKK